MKVPAKHNQRRSAPSPMILPAGALNPDRTLHWIGGATSCYCEEVIEGIKELMRVDKEDGINLIVTSPGGATGIAMTFFDSMRLIYRPKLVTVGSGDVDSAGIIIFLAGHERYLLPNTTMLLHLAGRTFDTAKRFTASEMEAMIKEDKLKDYQYASLVSKETGGQLTPEMVLSMMAANTVLEPMEAVNLGLAHGILT